MVGNSCNDRADADTAIDGQAAQSNRPVTTDGFLANAGHGGCEALQGASYLLAIVPPDLSHIEQSKCRPNQFYFFVVAELASYVDFGW